MDSLNNFMLKPIADRKNVFYATILVWVAAIIFLILAWINNDPMDTEKQKNYNNWQAAAVLGLILGMYLTICLCQI